MDLSTAIEPAAGDPGIRFRNTSGGNVIIHSGSGGETIAISTAGGVPAISGIAEGSAAGGAVDDDFLGVPVISANPAVPGGYVEIDSYSGITTHGSGAHGIYGYSSSGGYAQSVLDRLESFSEEGFTFEVTEVRDPAGEPLAFDPDGSVAVRGYLIDEEGNALTDDEGNIIEHGTFIIGQDGSYTVSFSEDENAEHAALLAGESLLIGLDYTVTGERDSNIRDDAGRLFVAVRKNEEGQLDSTAWADFETFGLSTKPLADAPRVFPDLEQYVSSMLADATAGGSGGRVIVHSDGAIETQGDQASGIYAYSIGGKGAPGRDSTFYLFWESAPTPGGDGESPGAIDVTANGSIITHGDEAAGISVLSAGGAGGAGGDGVAYRDGRRGGTGGAGGTVAVHGSASIETHGDYSSGILALSVGGNGGAGGSTGGAMSGGNGGYGGKGGAVTLAGDWDVTTRGDYAHGLWAKSLGGNAGDGGSGGWLFGQPGGGGIATDGGSVTLHSGGLIETHGQSAYGLYAQSVGGFGGSGGTSWGLFWSFGGDAESGGSGGNVELVNLAGGTVRTTGDYSHAVFAQSVGGGGGSGGGEFALVASLGGEGGSGGHGGTVVVENNGLLETSGIGAYGILAQSVGGGGGDGGSTGGLVVAIGGSGSETSDGGNVTVVNGGIIATAGAVSHGIFAESIGGGGGSGGKSSGLVSIGGSGGGGGDAGRVSITNAGTVSTSGNESYGILAQSVGGGGGSGGGAVSLTGGVSVAIGGSGAGGGHGNEVEVSSTAGSGIFTEGNRSYAIFAQSVGGGGGDGGYAIAGGTGAVSVAVGGNAGKGGDGRAVRVTSEGTIATLGEASYGIFAQSLGGGGGAGGYAVSGSYGGSGISVNLALGGTGGGGGVGDAVDVEVGGSITTSGPRAHGILAQSIGGSGGDGGFAIAGSIASGTSLNLAFGGGGGTGSRGGDVTVNGTAAISTGNHDAHGIFAQSVGGSGGSGGFSVASSLAGGTSLNLSVGGKGGTASSAGNVAVGSDTAYLGGEITTQGDRAYGILAQSVGGGGGAGGAAVSGALLGPVSIDLGFGGDGGTGGLGGLVNVYNAANITTWGQQSHGILAQSVGGGGGAGGLSISGGVTAFGGLALAMGGDGGSGNDAGDVTVFNRGSVQTEGEYAYGILAQSVGGGGGAGGASGAVMVNFSSLLPIPPEYPTGSVNIAISLGGDGGAAGAAGRVEVDNAGTITTGGDHGYGIFAQSVGGGGGDGGKSIAATANISMPSIPEEGEQPQLEVKVDFAMAIGGDGGAGGNGNAVDIRNRGLIDTSGIGAHGIFAQSVGGGGGSGADARSMILSIDPSNWSESDPLPDPTSISVGATLSVGGKGGAAGNGGTVAVTNEGTIVTRGHDAFGILAQSIGGGGGVGGSGYHGLDLQDFGVPEELAQFQDLLPVQDEGDLHIAVGGSGGAAGDGADVRVENSGDIITLGDGSLGILAQSIGGGGGLAGLGATGGEGSTFSLGGGGGAGGAGGNIVVDLLGDIHTEGIAAHGIFAQSVGGGGGYGGNVDKGMTDFGINLAIGGGGGAGGDGGNITINSAGNIVTSGDGAVGIFAQSVGGGGGVGGTVGTGFGFAGSVGGQGDGGTVAVVHTGNITTHGVNAHGIVAQSVGGADSGGNVSVRVSGDITVHGEGALAVIAQSEGTAGKRNIDVIYEGGTITGGSTPAVNLLGGAANSFTNHGTVTTAGGIGGTAVSAGAGDDTANNHGTIIGSVDLGTGVNAFYNLQGGWFDSGANIHLGSGNTLTNAGTLSPGGTNTPLTTSLGSDLVQSAGGVLALDMSMAGLDSDLLAISGSAQLQGGIAVNPIHTGYAQPGEHQMVAVSAADGVVADELGLVAPASGVVAYSLVYPSANEVAVNASVDFSPDGLGPNARRIGQHVNTIQLAGGSESFAPFAASLFDQPDTASLNTAYSKLSPVIFGSLNTLSDIASTEFNDAMHSCRQRAGDYRFVREGQCGWLRLGGGSREQRPTDLNPGYNLETITIAGGRQLEIQPDLHLGFGLSYQRADLESSFSSMAGDRFEAGMVVKRRLDATMISGSLSVGLGRYESERRIDLVEPDQVARGEPSLWTVAAHGRISHDLHRGGNAYLRPMVSATVINIVRDGFREDGAGGASLDVARESDSVLTVQPALEAGDEWELRGGSQLRPHLRLGLTRYLTENEHMITATMLGAPDGVAPFTVTNRADRTYADVVLGLDVLNTDRTAVRFDYTGQFSKKSTANAVWFKFSKPL